VLPTTIDGVIDCLQAIVDDSLQRGSRLGYFAALYKRMTISIRDGIRAGKFQDGPTWLQAYQASTQDRYTILQQLLIGINPHVMIDLGVAAARTCPGDQLPGLQHDFNMINHVIGSLFPIVDAQLDDLSPVEHFIDHSFLGRIKDQAINAAIDEGRRSSWGFAVSLANLDLPAQAIAIGQRDLRARDLGTLILLDPLRSLVRKYESQDVRKNIQVLDAAATAAKSAIDAALTAPAP
jgi:hypothetical protein